MPGGAAAAGVPALTAAGTAQAAESTGAPAAAGADHREVDVAVVGGGPAGLTAARDLAPAGKSVLAPEARDRVGGRVLNPALPPGVLTRYGTALRAPVGAIHWAGTETSTHWNGYVDGAVRSGERVAKEVVAGL